MQQNNLTILLFLVKEAIEYFYQNLQIFGRHRPLLELFKELQVPHRQDIRAISTGAKFIADRILEQKIGMQIWFSAINILVLPSSSACCPWDNINELALNYF